MVNVILATRLPGRWSVQIVLLLLHHTRLDREIAGYHNGAVAWLTTFHHIIVLSHSEHFEPAVSSRPHHLDCIARSHLMGPVAIGWLPASFLIAIRITNRMGIVDGDGFPLAAQRLAIKNAAEE